MHGHILQVFFRISYLTVQPAYWLHRAPPLIVGPLYFCIVIFAHLAVLCSDTQLIKASDNDGCVPLETLVSACESVGVPSQVVHECLQLAHLDSTIDVVEWTKFYAVCVTDLSKVCAHVCVCVCVCV